MVVQGSSLLATHTPPRHLTCFKTKPVGSVGNFMFMYAFLTGVCIHHGVSPFHCASMFFSPMPNSRKVKLMQFKKLFRLSSPPCPIPGPYFHDHDNLSEPYTIRFKPRVFDQPTGTTFLGFYQSFRYFSNPDAVRTIKHVFTPGKSRWLDGAQHLLAAQSEAKRLSSKLVGPVVCLSYLKFIPKHSFINSWTLSYDYYVAAIEEMQRRLGNSTLLVLIPSVQDSGNNPSDSEEAAPENDLVKRICQRFNISTAPSSVVEIGQAVYLDEVMTLHVLMSCPNLVLSPTSLSWWGAFLSGEFFLGFYTYVEFSLCPLTSFLLRFVL